MMEAGLPGDAWANLEFYCSSKDKALMALKIPQEPADCHVCIHPEMEVLGLLV